MTTIRERVQCPHCRTLLGYLVNGSGMVEVVIKGRVKATMYSGELHCLSCSESGRSIRFVSEAGVKDVLEQEV